MAQNVGEITVSEVPLDISLNHNINIKNLWRAIMPKVLSLVTFSAFLTGIGFFVIHSYIASFSTLFTFNISVLQYISAGINLLLAIIYYVILPIVLYALILSMIGGIVFSISYFFIKYNSKPHYLWNEFYKWWLPIYQPISPALHRFWKAYQMVAWALFVVIVTLVSFCYGTFYYAQSPRMFGGGMPSEVILIFREEQPVQNPIWGFPIDTVNNYKSKPVQLLIELSDGLIVRDPMTNIVTIVKNDILQGIVDNRLLSH